MHRHYDDPAIAAAEKKHPRLQGRVESVFGVYEKEFHTERHAQAFHECVLFCEWYSLPYPAFIRAALERVVLEELRGKSSPGLLLALEAMLGVKRKGRHASPVKRQAEDDAAIKGVIVVDECNKLGGYPLDFASKRKSAFARAAEIIDELASAHPGAIERKGARTLRRYWLDKGKRRYHRPDPWERVEVGSYKWVRSEAAKILFAELRERRGIKDEEPRPGPWWLHKKKGPESPP